VGVRGDALDRRSLQPVQADVADRAPVVGQRQPDRILVAGTGTDGEQADRARAARIDSADDPQWHARSLGERTKVLGPRLARGHRPHHERIGAVFVGEGEP